MAANARKKAVADAVRHVEPVAAPLSDEQLVSMATVLEANRVTYALIGGAGVQLHGVPIERTRDADILVERTPENLDRLARALNALGARLWVGPNDPDGLPVNWSPEILLIYEAVINTVTSNGPLDVNYRPDGIEGGYRQIADRVVTVRLLQVDVPVASLEDITRSKEAAGRDKDVRAVATIRKWMNATEPDQTAASGHQRRTHRANSL